MTFLEALTLGALQGITEWLPVSSEALVVLANIHLFGESGPLQNLISLAVYLHLGTFLAALVYFWDDVRLLLGALIRPSKHSTETRRVLRFLIIATLISGGVGGLLFTLLGHADTALALTGTVVTVGIGVLLLITAGLQFAARTDGIKHIGDLTSIDDVLLGVVQGFAALPGISRSGITIAALLLRSMNEAAALRLSFLMSLPIVLGGNIALNLDSALLTLPHLIALLAAFGIGLLTIHLLLTVARRVNVAWFVLGFGLLTIVAPLLG